MFFIENLSRSAKIPTRAFKFSKIFLKNMAVTRDMWPPLSFELYARLSRQSELFYPDPILKRPIMIPYRTGETFPVLGETQNLDQPRLQKGHPENLLKVRFVAHMR